MIDPIKKEKERKDGYTRTCVESLACRKEGGGVTIDHHQFIMACVLVQENYNTRMIFGDGRNQSPRDREAKEWSQKNDKRSKCRLGVTTKKRSFRRKTCNLPARSSGCQ